MDLLKGKICLITGSGRGIGNAIVRRFAEEGAIVYANTITSGELDEQAAELSKKYNTKVIPVYCDVCDRDAIKTYLNQIRKEAGRLDVLVNNAGVMKDDLLGMISEETIQKTFSVNVFAPIELTQIAVKLLRKAEHPAIVNVSSIVGLRGNAGQTVYSATKGAVATLTRTWARELASQNIRVNGLAPGKIDTDMFHSIGDDRVQEQLNEVAMGRLGNPGEVANAALFLASDLSSYITGDILEVTGGWFL